MRLVETYKDWEIHQYPKGPSCLSADVFHQIDATYEAGDDQWWMWPVAFEKVSSIPAVLVAIRDCIDRSELAMDIRGCA